MSESDQRRLTTHFKWPNNVVAGRVGVNRESKNRKHIFMQKNHKIKRIKRGKAVGDMRNIKVERHWCRPDADAPLVDSPNRHNSLLHSGLPMTEADMVWMEATRVQLAHNSMVIHPWCQAVDVSTCCEQCAAYYGALKQPAWWLLVSQLHTSEVLSLSVVALFTLNLNFTIFTALLRWEFFSITTARRKVFVFSLFRTAGWNHTFNCMHNLWPTAALLLPLNFCHSSSLLAIVWVWKSNRVFATLS